MIRFTQSPEGVVRVNRREPHRGRGFYLCPDLLCLNKAKKKKQRGSVLGIDGFNILEKGFFKMKDQDKGGRE